MCGRWGRRGASHKFSNTKNNIYAFWENGHFADCQNLIFQILIIFMYDTCRPYFIFFKILILGGEVVGTKGMICVMGYQ